MSKAVARFILILAMCLFCVVRTVTGIWNGSLEIPTRYVHVSVLWGSNPDWFVVMVLIYLLMNGIVGLMLAWAGQQVHDLWRDL